MTKLITSKKTKLEQTVSDEDWELMKINGLARNFSAVDIIEKKLKNFEKIVPLVIKPNIKKSK